MYIIKWQSNFTGVIGQGTQQFTLEDAKRIVANLNTERPGFRHWYEAV